MTTRRAPRSVAADGRPVGRAVTVGLALAVLAGLGWIAGMVCTLAAWPL
ncbi:MULTISPECIES: morphogenic membrane protein MmpA [unclassified Streptomyces]